MNLPVVSKPFVAACLVLILVSRLPLCFRLSTTSNTAVMSAPKPTKNDVSSAKEFKTLCITASKTYKIRVSNEAIRHLRLTMNTTVASASLLPEAIQVIIAALAETKKRKVGLEDVREWLAPPAPVDDEDSSEEEWSADDNLKGDPVHYIRKIVNWKR
ncbi:hypothetical protein PF011_g28574, partial [Phytophthora fragariae]